MESYRKVAIYCRVSTEEQKEKQSIKNQIDFADKYCQKNGLNPYKYYQDDGFSGSLPPEERPALSQLIEDAKQHKFERVLVYQLSQLARDTRISMNIAHELIQSGIPVKSMTEDFDSNNPMGKFMFSLLSGISEMERNQIRDRTILGKLRAAKESRFTGGYALYGYKINSEKKYEINEPEAGIVRKIFIWSGNDKMSCIQISKNLNSLKEPTYNELHNIWKGKKDKWHPGRISKILHDKSYTGKNIYKSNAMDEEIIREIPAVISNELYLKAQDTIKYNRTSGKARTLSNYLYRGLIRCNRCGLKFSGYKTPYKGNKGGFNRYRCGGKNSNFESAYGYRCDSSTIDERELDSIVWDELKFWILNESSINNLVESKLVQIDKEKENYSEELFKIKRKIDSKNIEREKIMDLYKRGVINVNEVEEQLKKTKDETTELLKLYEEYKLKIRVDVPKEDIIKNILEHTDKYKKEINSHQLTFEAKSNIIKGLVSEIVIDKTKDNKRMIFTETIRFTPDIKLHKRNKYKVLDTVNFRIKDKERGNIQQFHDNSLNIVYKFPFYNNKLVESLHNREGGYGQE